jgi:hypothetical protein
MEEAPENNKELYSAHANGMNEYNLKYAYPIYLYIGTHIFSSICSMTPGQYTALVHKTHQ